MHMKLAKEINSEDIWETAQVGCERMEPMTWHTVIYVAEAHIWIRGYTKLESPGSYLVHFVVHYVSLNKQYLLP